MKADDMNKMLSRIQSMNEDGEGTLKDEANPPKVKFADPPKPDDNKDEDQTLVDDDNSGGGVAFIEDDGSDEDEDDGSGGTWVRPPTSVVIPASSSSSSTPSTPSVRPLPTIPGGLNMKEKPSLKLTMGLPIDGKGPASASQASAVLRTARSPQEDEQPQEHLRPSGRRGPRRNNTSSSNSSTGSGSPIVRKTSFAVRGEKDNWAFRPSVEDVYEHMEEFFPDHDLDKEFIDTAAAGAASTEDSSSSSPTTEKPPAQGLAPPSRGIGHKKSIRRIAQDGRKRLQKAGMMKDVPAVGAGAGGGAGLLRRKSTKLWGSKMEEVTPGAAARMRKQPAMNAIPESPTEEEAANLSFKWVKGDLIGKGTYGQVYLALNATTGEMLAVKQVAIPQTDSDREDKRQTGVVDALVSEVELLKDLDHPNIVQYLGMERTDLNLNVFLEYVTGGSVGRCLRKHGKFEESVVKSFTSQILDGLEYLHTKNILHRDLKADNILVDLAGVCKISDFGISKRSDNIYEINANMSLQGSIFWMAPEVVSNQKKGYSAKIDIWSLGCVVLEMFCGRRPWSDEEAIQAMFKLGAERLAPPVPSDVTLSQVAAHFLSNCFIVDSEQRPTAARLLQHVFVEIPKDWSFEQTNLGRAIKKPKKLKK
ncbi:Pkinase-domain-containing protein [Atractiella rhizophila]|nr:Pkinase-domain-containing protein [Atractiella rhizophila]